ncbi:circularly permuted type 2 ATP-grasp protein, partial [Marinomonas arenicola]
DELIDPQGKPRAPAEQLLNYLNSLSEEELEKRRLTAEATIQEMGISFTVYTEEGNIDRAWPFDIVPRTIEAKDWKIAEAGLKQRLKALHLFIDDLYHD